MASGCDQWVWSMGMVDWCDQCMWLMGMISGCGQWLYQQEVDLLVNFIMKYPYSSCLCRFCSLIPSSFFLCEKDFSFLFWYFFIIYVCV